MGGSESIFAHHEIEEFQMVEFTGKKLLAVDLKRNALKNADLPINLFLSLLLLDVLQKMFKNCGLRSIVRPAARKQLTISTRFATLTSQTVFLCVE